ncbi:unnamed protein product [Paramecium octaurelia]|uniref:Uncharacterized protein n=1 Tax=Paramecium octaurelia TaxID=43137 RepID=A0A8S1S831_PAROT|nr:unnamed protein product [Paramecium octaurelia]
MVDLDTMFNNYNIQFKQRIQIEILKLSREQLLKIYASSPIFSIPYGTLSELLITGELLKKNFKEGREVYIFDWLDGTIKKINYKHNIQNIITFSYSKKLQLFSS